MDTAQDSSEAPGEIVLQVRQDKLKLLFHQSFPALFISLAIGLLYSWASWEQVERPALLIWLLLLCLTTFTRLALFLAYFHAEPEEADVQRWERPYVVTLLLSSLLWGAVVLFAMSPDAPVHQAFTLFVLIGMAGGAVSTYSAHRLMAVGSMLAVLLPSTLWLFAQDGRLQLIMALGVSIFMLAALRSTKVLAGALERSLRLTHELRQAHESAERLAKTDMLTGVNNRRAFFDLGQQIANYCQRNALPLCALLIDIDHFKEINDNHGHSSGDAALQQVGAVLRETFRKSDVCGRVGGEEFAVLLPGTPLAEAQAAAEKLRAAIAAMPLDLGGGTASLSVSIGVALADYDIDALLHHADAAMYRAKGAGRNRVICHGDEAAAPVAAAGMLSLQPESAA